MTFVIIRVMSRPPRLLTLPHALGAVVVFGPRDVYPEDACEGLCEPPLFELCQLPGTCLLTALAADAVAQVEVTRRDVHAHSLPSCGQTHLAASQGTIGKVARPVHFLNS